MITGVLSEDEVRALLRECVTVVRPGETLVVLAHANTTPNQLRELQKLGNVLGDERGFRILFLPGAELGVVEPGASGS